MLIWLLLRHSFSFFFLNKKNLPVLHQRPESLYHIKWRIKTNFRIICSSSIARQSGFKELEFSWKLTQSSNSLSDCRGQYIGRGYTFKPWESQHVSQVLWSFDKNRDVITSFWHRFHSQTASLQNPSSASPQLCRWATCTGSLQVSLYRVYRCIININDTLASVRTSRTHPLWHSTEIICCNEEPWRIKGGKLIKKFHLKLITESIKFTEINLIRYFLWFFPQSNIPRPSLILLHISKKYIIK